ncbi:hypothetical protein JG687_00014723, partial [Phytophthora cactorum]
TSKVLEQWLRSLLRTYGRRLAEFPRCFFSISKPSPRTAAPQTARLASRCVLTFPKADHALRRMFESVTEKDVLQLAGHRHHNVGELLPSMVTSLISGIGGISECNVFLDVGSGIGNVVVQFALQPAAKLYIGLEAQETFYRLATRLVRWFPVHKDLLANLKLHTGNASGVYLPTRMPYCSSTIVYVNNILFQEEANLMHEHEVCAIRTARRFVSTTLVCPRHCASCSRRFCAVWKHVKTVYGKMSWTANAVAVYIYERVVLKY